MDKMEYKLIEFIKNNPVLYEKQYRTIKYLDEKKAKWQEIGRILRKDRKLRKIAGYLVRR